MGVFGPGLPYAVIIQKPGAERVKIKSGSLSGKRSKCRKRRFTLINVIRFHIKITHFVFAVHYHTGFIGGIQYSLVVLIKISVIGLYSTVNRRQKYIGFWIGYKNQVDAVVRCYIHRCLRGVEIKASGAVARGTFADQKAFAVSKLLPAESDIDRAP